MTIRLAGFEKDINEIYLIEIHDLEGFIRVEMNLQRPINVISGTR